MKRLTDINASVPHKTTIPKVPQGKSWGNAKLVSDWSVFNIEGRRVSDSSIFLYFGWVLKDRRGATATCSFLFFCTLQSQRRPYRKEVVYSSHGCSMFDHCGVWAICSINHLRTPYRFQIAAGNTRCHIYGCIATTIVFQGISLPGAGCRPGGLVLRPQ